MPAFPANRVSNVVSAKSRRASDPRDPAPGAPRSPCADRARASRKLARWVHATSSTSPTTNTINGHVAARMKTSIGEDQHVGERHEHELPGRIPVLQAVLGALRGYRPDGGRFTAQRTALDRQGWLLPGRSRAVDMHANTCPLCGRAVEIRVRLSGVVEAEPPRRLLRGRDAELAPDRREIKGSARGALLHVLHVLEQQVDRRPVLPRFARTHVASSRSTPAAAGPPSLRSGAS